MRVYIFLALTLLASVTVFSQEPDEGDIQVWNETKVYFPSFTKTDDAGKKEKIATPFIMGTLRLGQDVRHFVGERIGVGVDFRINKYFKFTPSYYYIAEQPVKNASSFEHRLRFGLTGEKKWKNFLLSDRNRIEYRIRHNKSDSARYRNKFKVKVPIKSNDKEVVTFFAATEPFYDFKQKKFSRNELSSGIEKKFTKHFSAEFFYMLQNNAGSRLKNVNIFGVNMKFKID